MSRFHGMLATALLAIGVVSTAAHGAEKFFVYDLTTSTAFKGVYLAPPGTEKWGKNQALNDDDKTLQVGERVLLSGIKHGRYDVKLVDEKARVCIKRDVDLTKDLTFDVRDADLASCQ